MSTSAIGNPQNSYLQQILTNALQSSSAGSTVGAGSVTTSSQSDSTQLSPFAQIVSELQQLQQSDPTQYAQVTQQIATNLQNAAQTAQSDGNTNVASQLSQLATDFTTASQTGQLPNLKDLAQAVHGGGHHHHHAESASDGSSSASSSTSSDSSTTDQTQSQTLSSLFQTNASQNTSLNPGTIILNTLSSAGVNPSNG